MESLKIEREIKFLNESLEAGIITEEEYEAKLQEIEERRSELSEASEIPEQPEEEKIEEEPLIQINIDEPKEEPKVEIVDIPEEEEKKEQEKKSSMWKWLAAGAVAIILLFVFFNTQKIQEEPTGQVVNPPAIPVKDVDSIVTIINDKNCGFCETNRMEKVLSQLFPGVEFKEVDISETQLDLKSLPAFIFDNNITKAEGFGDFKRALTEQEGVLIMKPGASGAPFYFKRSETKSTLDVFLNPEDPAFEEVQKTVQEARLLLKNVVKVNIIKVTPDMRLSKELDITTSPTFLVNNRYKFSGLQPASAIREKFCVMNGC